MPQWGKGRSGNPLGRPKKEKLIQPHLESCLAEKCSAFPQTKEMAISLNIDPEKHTIGYLLSMSAILHAVKGKPVHLQEVMNRTDGKVRDKIEHEITPKLYGHEAPVDEV